VRSAPEAGWVLLLLHHTRLLPGASHVCILHLDAAWAQWDSACGSIAMRLLPTFRWPPRTHYCTVQLSPSLAANRLLLMPQDAAAGLLLLTVAPGLPDTEGHSASDWTTFSPAASPASAEARRASSMPENVSAAAGPACMQPVVSWSSLRCAEPAVQGASLDQRPARRC